MVEIVTHFFRCINEFIVGNFRIDNPKVSFFDLIKEGPRVSRKFDVKKFTHYGCIDINSLYHALNVALLVGAGLGASDKWSLYRLVQVQNYF